MSNTRFNTTRTNLTQREFIEFKRDWIKAMRESGPIVILNSEECKSH